MYDHSKNVLDLKNKKMMLKERLAHSDLPRNDRMSFYKILLLTLGFLLLEYFFSKVI